MVKARGHSSPPPRMYQFPLWGTPTHHALHAFMVLVALWSSCSPGGRVTSNNPPGVKLYPPWLIPLATRHHLPRGTCSLFESPLLPDPTPTKPRFVVAPSSMAATMTTTPRSGNNATLGRRGHAAWRTLGVDDDTLGYANLSNNATPLGACSVTTTPSSAMTPPRRC